MYAIIKTGGKQVKVNAGEKIKVEKLPGEVGTPITFNAVLFIGGTDTPKFGNPIVQGAKVTGTITKQDKAKKILVFKKTRRTGFRKTYGHRQPFTEIEIKEIA